MKDGQKYAPCFKSGMFVMLLCNLNYVTMLVRAS